MEPRARRAAICGYSPARGGFLKYASMLIGSRLIDYHRKEQRHRKAISLETPLGEEEDKSLGETLSDGKDHSEEMTVREATRKEIEELTAQMKDFGVSLTDVAENCPKQERTLGACRKALNYAKEHPEIDRRLTSYEYDRVLKAALFMGIDLGYMQERSSAREEYTPLFDLEGL